MSDNDSTIPRAADLPAAGPIPSGDEIRAMNDAQIVDIVRDYKPRYQGLMAWAEELMERARPLADALFVARGELAERRIDFPEG